MVYVISDRSEITFRRLICKIPIEYLKSQSYSDYGGRTVTSHAILKVNYKQVSKESGPTNYIERYWATLRARITRYVRKSLSFSRKLRYHHLVTKLFIIDYNQSCLSTHF